MKTKELPLVATYTSPAAAGTVVGPSLSGLGLSRADILMVDAVLTGATGGTVDVYLQRATGVNDWTDWAHFPQVAVAAAATRITFAIDGAGTISMQPIGGGTDAAPGVALAVNSYTNVMPGGNLRVVTVAGAGTSAGASQKITVTPYTERFG